MLIEDLGGTSQQRYLFGLDGRFFMNMINEGGFGVLDVDPKLDLPMANTDTDEAAATTEEELSNYGGDYG